MKKKIENQLDLFEETEIVFNDFSEEIKTEFVQQKLSTLKVWYGFDKLSKIRKQRALRIRYENTAASYGRKMRHIERMGKTSERFQTIAEASDGKGAYREFTDWVIFIDKSPFNGDIDAVLEQNFQLDSNNVSIDERERIRKELKKIFLENKK